MCSIKKWMGVCLLFSFVCMTSIANLHAEEQYSNKLLAEMAQQLVDTYKMNVKAGEALLLPICDTKPLIVEKDSRGVVNHIGIKLFDRGFIRHYPSTIYHFIERYFLELLLLPSEEEIRNKMRMERVKILSEMYPMQSVRRGLKDIISAFEKEPSFCIMCNNNRYTVSCMINNRVLVEVNFPVRYELISGITKNEAENSVYMSLMAYQKKDYVPFKADDLFVYKDSLYYGNEDYYLAEEIVSTSYYKKDKDVMVPVLSASWLSESVCNLFNSLYDWGVEAEITQNLYGGKKMSYTEPLAKVMDFYISQGCKLYTGIRKYDKSTIEGVVIAVNTELGYQHLLNFSLQKDLFENPKGQQVKMKVYSYIPIHNVSSMFDDKKTKE